MKKKFSFIIGLTLMIIISFLFFYQRKNNKDEQKNDYHLTIEEKQLLQEGDIILRRGFGIISDMIVKYAKNDYPVSHCGIVVTDSLGKLFVIHTVSNTLAKIDGMQKDKLDVFIKGSHKNSVIIIRYNYENDTLPKKIAEQANYYLSKQIPFDHRFDCEDTTAFFCTELIRMVFKTAIEVDLYENETDCMSFSPFLNPSKFTMILNHNDITPLFYQ
jgi:hypothetical protein